jgi:hypothetical protein
MIESFLQQHGFRLLSHCTPRQLEGRYWDASSDGHERVLGCLSIAHCEPYAPASDRSKGRPD